MLSIAALFVSVVVVAIGLLIFWANPARIVNRVVCTGSLHAAAWLACWQMGGISENGLFWFRWTCAIGGLIPLHLLIAKDCIAAPQDRFDFGLLRRIRWWLPISVAAAIVPLTSFFIPPESTPEHKIFGWGYYGYIATALCLYGLLMRDTLKSMRTLTGGPRLELQLWLVGGCATAGTILLRMILGSFLPDPSYTRIQPLLVLVFYSVTAFAATTHRIFDASQLMRIGLQRILLIGVVATVAYFLNELFDLFLPSVLSFMATIAIALWFASLLNDWLARFFHFYPQAVTARQAAFEAAGRETKIENLEKAFGQVLKGWGHSDRAIIVHGSRENLRGSGIELAGDAVLVTAMRQLRWATPERLARERPTPERLEVSQFLKDHGLGVLVIGEGPTLTALIGVGVAPSRWPFTYPQVTQLQELASIIEGALERAHFSMKVQHAEQLATVGLLGASLAHEIRNPLVTIKTFVQLLPTRHHDEVFREKFFRLIGHEVDRIDRLTVQLLELASPRVYTAEPVELHSIIQACVDLVAAKATDKHITFFTDCLAVPDVVWTDASAAKQVILNLCFNAIQALETCEGERWVRISTRPVPVGIEMTVSDSGRGIAEEIRQRLFQPFQSTKSTGFGLGLAICSDILANLSATIAVDPSIPGQGATFRVKFPCQPSSS
jgi:signal transduction histidine kinase